MSQREQATVLGNTRIPMTLANLTTPASIEGQAPTGGTSSSRKHFWAVLDELILRDSSCFKNWFFWVDLCRFTNIRIYDLWRGVQTPPPPLDPNPGYAISSDHWEVSCSSWTLFLLVIVCLFFICLRQAFTFAFIIPPQQFIVKSKTYGRAYKAVGSGRVEPAIGDPYHL